MNERSRWIIIPSWVMVFATILGPTQVWAEGYSTERGEGFIQEFTSDSSAAGGLDTETSEEDTLSLGVCRYLDFVNDVTMLVTNATAGGGDVSRFAIAFPPATATIGGYFITGLVGPAGISCKGNTCVVANAGGGNFTIFDASGAAAGAPLPLDPAAPAASPGNVVTGVPAGALPWSTAFSPVAADTVLYSTNRGGAGATDGLLHFSTGVFGAGVVSTIDPAFIDPTDIEITGSGAFGWVCNFGVAPPGAVGGGPLEFVVTFAPVGSTAVQKFSTIAPPAVLPIDGTILLPAGTNRHWGLALTPTRCWVFANTGSISSLSAVGGSADSAGAPTISVATVVPSPPLAVGTPLWDGAFDAVSGGKVFISAGIDVPDAAAPPGPGPAAGDSHWIIRFLIDGVGDPIAGSGTFVTAAAGDEDSFLRDVGIRPPPPPVGGVSNRKSGGHGCFVSTTSQSVPVASLWLLLCFAALGAGVIFGRRRERLLESGIS